MSELRQALAEISAIRTQVARETQFRGYGPRSTAATGALAILVAGVQSIWFKASHDDARVFLMVWVSTAVVAAGVVVLGPSLAYLFRVFKGVQWPRP